MAKKKSYKSLAGLNKKLQSNIQSNSNLPDRISALEKELKDSITLAMSMIAVNKELIGRLQENEQSGTATKTDNGKVSSQDTSADILSKIYGFFIKGSEQDKRNFEIQRDFAEERAMESKRRKPYARRSTASKIDPKKSSSNPIMDLLGFIGSGIGGIFKFITGGLYDLIASGLSKLKDTIVKMIEKLPGGKLLTDIMGGALSAGGVLVKIITGVLKSSTGLIWDMLKPFVMGAITGVMGGLSSILSSMLSYIVSFIPGMGVAATKAIMARLGPAGLISALGLTAYQAYSGIKNLADTSIYSPEILEQQKQVDLAKSYVDDPLQTILNAEGVEARDKYLSMNKEDQKKYKQDKFQQYLDSSAKLKEQLENRYDQIAKILEPLGYEKTYALTQAPRNFQEQFKSLFQGQGELSGVDLKTIKILGFKKKGDDSGNLIQFAKIGDGPGMSTKVDNPFLDNLLFSANVSVGENIMQPLDDLAQRTSQEGRESVRPYLSPEGNAELARQTSGTSTATPISSTSPSQVDTPAPLPSPPTAAPVSTPSAPVSTASTPAPLPSPPTAAPAPLPSPPTAAPAPLPSPPTAAPAPQSIPTPIPNLQSYDQVEVGKTEVVNLPTQTSASTGETDFAGTPNVRNPNPVVYRTAMRNDQAQP